MAAKYVTVAIFAFSGLVSRGWALGSATIVNNCDYPIYSDIVRGSYDDGLQKINGSLNYPYSEENVGISIKISPVDAMYGNPISQFEFTWANGKISYDLSNINGYPFWQGGIAVVPSMQNDPNNPTCVPIYCPAGQTVCSAAYNSPDDLRTLVCDQGSSLVMTICPSEPSEPSFSSRGEHIHRRHLALHRRK